MQAVSHAADERRFPPLAWLLLLLAAAWATLWFVHALPYWEDDAYIHLEFARSLSRGQGFAFDGHIVYGDTSPLWVWLLAATHAAIPNWMAAGKTLTALAAVFALSGAFAFARRLASSLGPANSRIFAAAMVLVLVVNPYFAYWAFSGMEALAAAGLVCWGLAAISGSSPERPIAPGRFLIGCLCAGVAPLLRPEMSFFTLLLGLVLFVRWTNLPVRASRKIRLFFAGLALVMGPGVAWAAFAMHTFGSFLPNTNAAKRAGPGDSVLRHLFQIYAFGFPLVMLGFAALLVWLVIGRRRPDAVRGRAVAASLDTGAWLLFVWTALNCVFYVMNHTYVQTRYIFVTAPVLTIALLAMARKLWPRLYTVGVAFGLLFGVGISLLATWPLINNKIQVDRDYAALAAFFRTLPPDAPVAHYSIGEAAFLSEHPLIDLGGITRPGIIPFLWDVTDNRRVWWAHEQGAKYAVVDHAPEPGCTLVWSRSIPTTGWFLNPRHYALKESLMVWKLPPSPTLPLPPDMPTIDVP
ncbi:MAG TPA: hypothetical protein VKV02_09035 [Acidobacteriaceae bacterium]|nr:hypothetical protein [Acidobacteriaceae bacterium]